MSTRSPSGTVELLLAGALAFCVPSSANGIPQDTGGACIPASERAGRPFGCFILAAQPIGKLDHPTFWHLETFATRAAAEKAQSTHGAVLEAFDKIWLLTIADAGWRSNGGTHVAEIGPIATTAGRDYTAQFMEATFRPGMKSRIHRHSGPEAWYTLSGETCLETPDGTRVGRAGGPPVIVPQGPPMELTATGTETRRALVLILHDSAQPHTTVISDWQPQGLCSKASGAEPASTEQSECRVSRGMQSNDALKAAVPQSGKIVFAPKGPGFVDRDGALGIKFPWWRLVPGSLIVGGRRLDGEAAPARAYMNHGYGEQGFLPTYLVFPTPGCWQITGRLGEQSLTFVVYVEKVGDGPDWRFEGLPNDDFWYQTTL